MKFTVTLLLFISIGIMQTPCYASERCYKFKIFLFGEEGKATDTAVTTRTSLNIEIFNCGDTPIPIFTDFKIGLEDENEFFLHFYHIVNGDTLPYCSDRMYLYRQDGFEIETDLIDSILPNTKKLVKERYINDAFYHIEPGEYLIRAACQLPIKNRSGYYYQESENTIHAIIKQW